MGTQALLLTQAAVETISTISEAKARSKAARYEADAARQQAEYQRRLAERDADTLRRKADRVLGRQVAKFAAAGMDPGSGSALLAQQSLASEAEIEALEIRNAGYLRAASFDRSAGLTLYRAREAERQIYRKLGTSLLSRFESKS